MSGPERPGGRPEGRDRRDGPDGPPRPAETERFASFVRRVGAAYHDPPPTPRDEIWTGVEAVLRSGPPEPEVAERPEIGEGPEGADPLLAAAAAGYHAPPEPPRDEMWARIEGARELRRALRDRARPRRALPWLTGVAIAASLVIGIAIGRQSADRPGAAGGPAVAGTDSPPPAAPLADAAPSPSREEAGGGASERRANEAAGDPRDDGGATPLETAPDAGARLAAGPSGRPEPSAATGVGSGRDAAGRPPRNETALRYATLEHFGRVETLLTSFRATGADESDEEVARWAENLLAETRLLLDLSTDRDPRLASLLEELELALVQIAGLDASPAPDERDLIAEGIERQGTLGRLRAVVPAGPAGYLTGT